MKNFQHFEKRKPEYKTFLLVRHHQKIQAVEIQYQKNKTQFGR